MRSKRVLSIFALLLAVALLVTACRSSELPPTPTSPPAAVTAATTAPTTESPPTDTPVPATDTRGTYRYAAYWGFEHGNPIVTGSSFLEYMFDPLYRLGAEGNPVPRLAESWDISPDGKTYTFYLREDVKWHDGEPFTAADVTFTVAAILDPDTETGLRDNLQVAGENVTCEAVDDYTVKFTLPEPYAPFIYKIPAIQIVPKHLLENEPDINTAAFNQNPVGTGPFMWKELVPGDHMTFVANDDFYLGKPGCKAVIVRLIPDSAAAVAALKAGEIDVVESEEPTDHAWAAENDYKAYWSLPGGIMYLWLNPAKVPAFGDVKVRQAMSYALDRDALTKVYDGSEPAYNIISPYGVTSRFYNQDVTKYTYDPDMARELLEEAGWTDTDGDGFVDKNGQNLGFTVIGQTGWKTAQDMLTVTQAWYKDVGIDMQIQLLESSAFREARGNPEVVEASFTGTPSPLDPDDLRVVYHSQGGRNLFGYVNERVDELFAQGVVESDLEKRKAIYAEIQKLTLDDMPYIPTVFYSVGLLVNPHLKGLPDDMRGVDSTSYQALFSEKLEITE